MPRQKRIPSGRPMPETDVVAVDAIALLAGVNYGSVVKVLAAIEAIKIHTGQSADSIVAFTDSPTEPVHFDGTDTARIDATDKFIHDLVNNSQVAFLDYALRHRQRFGVEQAEAT